MSAGTTQTGGHGTSPTASTKRRKEADVSGARLPQEHSAATQLMVYGTGWCPDVRRTRALLDAAGVAYDYVDIDEDKAARKLVRRLQRGHRRVPTLVWPDGTVQVEPADDEVHAHLFGRQAGSDIRTG
ncbi:glutaredoxin family protein [Micromonospora echinaurantiaca]|uniref:glutaredoxin family protein n=1 Tax=Micromonospora echinaurantiaca TaxID=47857 RepID=UPI0037BA1B0A